MAPLIVTRNFIHGNALPAAGSVAAPTFVQAGGIYGFAAPTIAVTLGAAVQSGSAGVVIVWWGFTGFDLNTITDDKGNNWMTNQIATLSDSTSGWSCAMYALGNITNGPTTITANINTDNAAMIVGEYKGALAASNPCDGAGHANVQASVATTANAITSGSITTSQTNGMIVGFTNSMPGGSSNTCTVGSSFTLRVNSATQGYAEDQQQASAGAIAATFTASAAGNTWMSAVLALKHA